MKKIEIINIGINFGIKANLIELIILKTTDLSKNQLFLVDEIDDKYIEEIKNSFDKIKKGHPIEYLLENTCFYGLDFFVNKNVLIPRDDTEVMVGEVINYVNKKQKNYTLIDVGTGSGCIPISVIKNVNKIPKKCYALDISEHALKVAKYNVEYHSSLEEINLERSDLLEYFLNNKFDSFNKGSLIITANLPYIKNADFDNMDKQTIKYEPDLALYGGEETGFELYERLLSQIFMIKESFNITEVILFIEIGFDQKNYSESYLMNKNLESIYYKDNSGIDRCIQIYI